MGDILTIKAKILAFIKEKGIKKVDFFEAAGIQSSNFKGKNMSSQPGGDIIVKILTLYPDLSAEWLMRGEGNMFKSNNTDTFQKLHIEHEKIEQDHQQDYEKNSIPPTIIDKLLTQAEEIGMLKQTIKQLEREKEELVSVVNGFRSANVG